MCALFVLYLSSVIQLICVSNHIIIQSGKHISRPFYTAIVTKSACLKKHVRRLHWILGMASKNKKKPPFRAAFFVVIR